MTSLLNDLQLDEYYDELLDQAKEANFDCYCGYDRNVHIDNDIHELSLLECIYLSQDLNYKDIMKSLVQIWQERISDWNDAYINMLIKFNTFLNIDNEKLYKDVLKNSLAEGNTMTIISSYTKLIRYYIDKERIDKAYVYLSDMLETTNYYEIVKVRLFGDVLEETFEIICKYNEAAKELWKGQNHILEIRK